VLLTIKKGNWNKALHHFTKAKDVNKNEEAVQIEKYIQECQSNIEPVIENEKIEPKKVEENKPVEVVKPIIEEKKRTQTTKREKLKDIVDKEVDGVKNESNKNVKKNNDDEIIIEEVKTNKYETSNIKEKEVTQKNTTPKVDKEMIHQATNQIKNMKDEELSSVTSMFKGMDNTTIKQMMQMQGMTMTDDQINMMKNNINPDMFKMMANNPEMMENAAKFKMNNSGNSNTTTTPPTQTNSRRTETNIDREESYGGMEQNISNNNSVSNNTTPNPMSFPGGFPANMDMSSMLNFVQSNPEMMKMMGPQISSMMGGMGGQGGGNPDMMMNAMQNILWVMSIPQRIKAFYKSTRGMIILVCAIILIIAYFYR